MMLVDAALVRLRGLFDRLLSRRNRFPGFVNRVIDWVAENPTSLVGRIAARGHGRYDPADVPPPLIAPKADDRILIGPTNYAGQGWQWARALDAAGAAGSVDPGSRNIAARNLAVEEPAGFAFPADREVPVSVYHGSKEWQQGQLDATLGFTHVLFEAERPMFGRLLGRDVAAEAAYLAAEGLSVAYIAHGTDVRLPSRHATSTPWSPYRDDVYLGKYEREADRNIRLLRDSGRPVFVSTPDLLADVPFASWCPVVVDADGWQSDESPGEGGIPVVVHIPSRAAIKGTHLIDPVMRRLHAENVIEYVTAKDIPASRMPDFYRRADIVLDQFRLGSYGVAACEAMATGRAVVGHITSAVRADVRSQTGLELPIHEATPATIESVIRELAADRDRLRAVASQGPGFVASVHSGTRSARTLIQDWIVT